MADQAHLHDPALLKGWFDMAQRTIAVDFDGVLHPYTKGWIGSVPDAEGPIPGASAFLVVMRERGYRIVVFSTRADHEAGKKGIEHWLHQNGLSEYVDEVTHVKVAAVAYVDDRAVAFTGANWGTCGDRIEALAAMASHGAAR